MRSVLEEADGFDAAVERLAGAKLLAPVYFIVGGNATSQVTPRAPPPGRRIGFFSFDWIVARAP